MRIRLWVLLALVVGLLVGFYGGYSYNNLNAGSPATAPTTTTAPTASENQANAFAFAYAQSIATDAINQSLADIDTAITDTTSFNSAVLGLSSKFLPRASAQGTCGGDFSSQKLLDLAMSSISLIGDISDGCLEFRLNGSANITVYYNPSGKDPKGAATVTLSLQITKVYYDKDCKEVTEQLPPIEKTFTFVYSDGKIKAADTLPPGMKKLCSVRIPLVNTVIGKLDKDKCPNCKIKPVPVPVEESQVQ